MEATTPQTCSDGGLVHSGPLRGFADQVQQIVAQDVQGRAARMNRAWMAY